MKLPGTHYDPRVKDAFARFYLLTCQPCAHNVHCTILAHAGHHGSASEWREVDGQHICIRQETNQ